MTFEELETTNFNGETEKRIVIDFGDGNFKSFPAVKGNPEYDAWLEAQTPEPKKK
jgi:hypothetical protein